MAETTLHSISTKIVENTEKTKDIAMNSISVQDILIEIHQYIKNATNQISELLDVMQENNNITLEQHNDKKRQEIFDENVTSSLTEVLNKLSTKLDELPGEGQPNNPNKSKDKKSVFDGIFAGLFPSITPIFSSLSKLINIGSKLFAPLLALTGAFAGIQGFMKGFEEGGIVEGIQRAVATIFDEIVVKTLNLLKDIVSWLARFLGFDEIAKGLDAFDFRPFFDTIFESVKGTITGIYEFLKNTVNTIDRGVKNAIEKTQEFISNISTTLGSIKESLMNGVNDTASVLKNGIMGVANSFINLILGIFERVRKSISDVVPNRFLPEFLKTPIRNPLTNSPVEAFGSNIPQNVDTIRNVVTNRTDNILSGALDRDSNQDRFNRNTVLAPNNTNLNGGNQIMTVNQYSVTDTSRSIDPAINQ